MAHVHEWFNTNMMSGDNIPPGIIRRAGSLFAGEGRLEWHYLNPTAEENTINEALVFLCNPAVLESIAFQSIAGDRHPGRCTKVYWNPNKVNVEPRHRLECPSLARIPFRNGLTQQQMKNFLVNTLRRDGRELFVVLMSTASDGVQRWLIPPPELKTRYMHPVVLPTSAAVTRSAALPIEVHLRYDVDTLFNAPAIVAQLGLAPMQNGDTYPAAGTVVWADATLAPRALLGHPRAVMARVDVDTATIGATRYALCARLSIAGSPTRPSPPLFFTVVVHAARHANGAHRATLVPM